MKPSLVYWHKARLQGRYLLEMEIFRIERSEKYPDGVRYGLILIDQRSGKRVLMDNHHPKGHHIHLNDQVIPYKFIDEHRLIKDFKALIETYVEVTI